MKVLIVYESVFGNTEKIARAVAGGFAHPEDVTLTRVQDVNLEQLKAVDLLVIGSPTRQFQSGDQTRVFLPKLAGVDLKGVKTAAFDTRLSMPDMKSGCARFFISRGGYAAPKIAARLAKAGGSQVIAPEGFLVKDSEGPLLPGELERASEWGRQLDRV